MNIIRKERLNEYIVEVIRTSVIILLIYILNYFFSSLPFVVDVNIFNEKIYLGEFFSLLMMVLSGYMIYEFAKRTSKIVDEMVLIISNFGSIHSYAVYLIITIVIYFAGYGIFVKLKGIEWVWAYNLVFIGFSIFYILEIFVLFYKNSHSFSQNIYNIFVTGGERKETKL